MRGLILLSVTGKEVRGGVATLAGSKKGREMAREVTSHLS